MKGHYDYVETTWDLYWCPQEQREVSCPGPCPNGDEHPFVRTEVSMSRVVPPEVVLQGARAVQKWIEDQ